MYLLTKAVSEERIKEMYRTAENERLARKYANKDPNILQETRQLLGRSLVSAGKKLLDEKQKPSMRLL